METFHANKGYKLVVAVFIAASPFSRLKFVVHFSNVTCTKKRSCTSLLFIWKWITSILFLTGQETNDINFSPLGLVFPTGPLLGGPLFYQVQDSGRPNIIERLHFKQKWILNFILGYFRKKNVLLRNFKRDISIKMDVYFPKISICHEVQTFFLSITIRTLISDSIT